MLFPLRTAVERIRQKYDNQGQLLASAPWLSGSSLLRGRADRLALAAALMWYWKSRDVISLRTSFPETSDVRLMI
jgi:hypothetical protein